jgi:hypothetical protein
MRSCFTGSWQAKAWLSNRQRTLCIKVENLFPVPLRMILRVVDPIHQQERDILRGIFTNMDRTVSHESSLPFAARKTIG